MTRIGTTIAFACFASAAPVAAQEAPQLDWLVGRWCAEAEKGRFTCEDWKPMADGVMQGETKVFYAQHTVEAESMRITARAGQLVYRAEPAGQEPTEFHAVAMPAAQAVRFENRAHDYPQVVRYWREGDVLNAEISLADGSKARRWAYRLYRGVKP
jgi:hypothetical protein